MSVRMPAVEVLAEVDWLLGGDVHPELIAQTLGRSLDALEMLARKHGRPDLSRLFGHHAALLRRGTVAA